MDAQENASAGFDLSRPGAPASLRGVSEGNGCIL